MSDNDFMRRRQDAVERMREMSRKAAESSAQPMPPTPPFVRLQNRGLFLVEDMRMKRERSAKRRMESAKCRPINDNIKEEKFVLRAVSHGA